MLTRYGQLMILNGNYDSTIPSIKLNITIVQKQDKDSLDFIMFICDTKRQRKLKDIPVQIFGCCYNYITLLLLYTFSV